MRDARLEGIKIRDGFVEKGRLQSNVIMDGALDQARRELESARDEIEKQKEDKNLFIWDFKGSS